MHMQRGALSIEKIHQIKILRRVVAAFFYVFCGLRRRRGIRIGNRISKPCSLAGTDSGL